MKNNSIKSEIISIIQNVKKNQENYASDMNLSSQGIDSLDMFDIMLIIAENYKLDIDFSEQDESDWNTVDKIIQNIIELTKYGS
ncbi:MAG: phosphopantetheine-binding protein [Gammaproteobacteria bacterium]